MDSSDFFTAKTVIMSAMCGMMFGVTIMGLQQTGSMIVFIFNIPFLAFLCVFFWLDIKQADSKREPERMLFICNECGNEFKRTEEPMKCSVCGADNFGIHEVEL